MPDIRLVIWTSFFGLIILAIYLVIKRVLLPMLASRPLREKLLDKSTLVERCFWPVFLVFLGISLILSHALVGLATCVFFTFVLWKPINDYFLGLVYLIGKTYATGQHIRYQDRMGTIKSFNPLSLEMECDDGESLDIPYRFFIDAMIIRTSPQSGITSHSILMSLTKPCDLEMEKQKIKSILVSLPWVLPTQKIVIELLSEDSDSYNLRIIVQGIDRSHLEKVESKIKAIYSRRSMDLTRLGNL